MVPALGTSARAASRRSISMPPPTRRCLRSVAVRPASTTLPMMTERYRSIRLAASSASTRLSDCLFSSFLRGLFFQSGPLGDRRERLAEKARAFKPVAPRLFGGLGDADAHAGHDLGGTLAGKKL